MKFVHFLTLTLFTGLLYGQNSLSLDLNDEDIALHASFDLNTMSTYENGTAYIVSTDYFHTNKSDNLGTVGIRGQNALQGIRGLYIALGMQVAVTSDFVVLPMQIQTNYTLPLSSTIPSTSWINSLSYAPSVLSFQDAQQYTAFQSELTMEVIPNIHLFTGYRHIETDYETADHTFNESGYAGMRMVF